MMTAYKEAILYLVPLFLIVTGCDIFNSDDDDGGDGPAGDARVTVSMQLTPFSESTAQTTSPAKQAVNQLTEVKLLVEELELENLNDDLYDFEVNDLIVNLPTDGSEVEIVTAEVPAGTYDEFNLEVNYDDDTRVSDPDFINEVDDDDGYSVVVRGIYDGEEFLFRTDEDYEMDLDLNPPLEITDKSSPSFSIMIDSSEWFKDAAGNNLDPRDPANFDRIEENIELSFDIVEGDDNIN